MAKIYEKGQITIPKAVRAAAGLAPGDRVVVEAREGEVVIRKPRGVLEFEPPQTDRNPLPWPEARHAARDERSAQRRHSGRR
jgi:AbrB family looped-hinge helix DNA binding protein